MICSVPPRRNTPRYLAYPKTASFVLLPSQACPPLTTPSQSRLDFVDWLRVACAIVVFLFHVAHVFDIDPAGSVKNNETSMAWSVIAFFTYQWMMQAFFVLAGIGAGFSLRVRADGQYLKDRFHRLLVPCIGGTLILIPWNGYMSALNHGIFQGSFWSYLPTHFQGISAALKLPQNQYTPSALFVISWHLWFLSYLFLFSALTLPLFRYLERAKDHGILRRAGAFTEKPWGLLAMGLPLGLIKLTLDARFPSHTDWSETLVWFALFIYGWIFAADGRFLQAIEKQRLSWLAAGCVCFAAMALANEFGYLSRWLDHPDYTWDYELYQILATVNTWAWVLSVIGFGRRWLNFRNGILEYASEAALPFYILHQPAVLTIGFLVVQLKLGIPAKSLIITLSAFIATILWYEALVRRTPVMRALFGLRPRIQRP